MVSLIAQGCRFWSVLAGPRMLRDLGGGGLLRLWSLCRRSQADGVVTRDCLGRRVRDGHRVYTNAQRACTVLDETVYVDVRSFNETY